MTCFSFRAMSISLCMIVKNEEDWIVGAIESVKSIVDEIIIADTGSTDRTVDLARPFNPKILRFQWTDSFAEARNLTLAEARHPWILVLDADERIAARELPLLTAATSTSADGYNLIQRNYVFGNQVFGWTGNSGDYEEGRGYPGYVDNPLIRFFRNSHDIRFRGVVHEIVDPHHLPPHLRFENIPVVMHHYGKVRGQERVASKQRFYLQLGLKKVEDEPANGKAWFDLGIQYQELNSHQEAGPCFEKAFTLVKQPVALLYWAISEKHRGQRDRAFELLNQALQAGLDTFDVHLELGNVQLSFNRPANALDEYRICLRMRANNPVATFNCGLALRKMNDVAEAERYYRNALRLDPDFNTAALELATLLDSTDRSAEAAGFLESVLQRDPELRGARLTLAKIHVGNNRPQSALDLLANGNAEDAVAQSLIGAAYLQMNDLDRAEHHLESALKRDRSLIDPRFNLAQIYERKGQHAKAERFRSAAALAAQMLKVS